MALSTIAKGPVSYRTSWPQKGWRGTLLKIWDDFSVDGEVGNGEGESGAPIGTLTVRANLVRAIQCRKARGRGQPCGTPSTPQRQAFLKL